MVRFFVVPSLIGIAMMLGGCGPEYGPDATIDDVCPNSCGYDYIGYVYCPATNNTTGWMKNEHKTSCGAEGHQHYYGIGIETLGFCAELGRTTRVSGFGARGSLSFANSKNNWLSLDVGYGVGVGLGYRWMFGTGTLIGNGFSFGVGSISVGVDLPWPGDDFSSGFRWKWKTEPGLLTMKNDVFTVIKSYLWDWVGWIMDVLSPVLLWIAGSDQCFLEVQFLWLHLTFNQGTLALPSVSVTTCLQQIFETETEMGEDASALIGAEMGVSSPFGLAEVAPGDRHRGGMNIGYIAFCSASFIIQFVVTLKVGKFIGKSMCTFRKCKPQCAVQDGLEDPFIE